MARLVEVSEMVRSTVKTVEPESVVSKRRRSRYGIACMAACFVVGL